MGSRAEFSLMIKCETGQNILDDVGKSMGGRRREGSGRGQVCDSFFSLEGVTMMEVPNYEKSDLYILVRYIIRFYARILCMYSVRSQLVMALVVAFQRISHF